MIYGDDNVHDALEKLAGAQREAYVLMKPKLLAALTARSPSEFRRASRASVDAADKLTAKQLAAIAPRGGGGKGILSSLARGPKKSMRRGHEKLVTREHRTKGGIPHRDIEAAFGT